MFRSVVLELMVIFILGFISINAKVVLKIRIYNYGNDNDIKHDGGKCETFHWVNDNCDPMFDICVSGEKRCDLLKYAIDHWRNKKFITTVLQRNIFLDKIQRSLSVEVKVDDHDKMNSHDHIAVFKAQFDIGLMNYNYGKAMTVTPLGISVVLYATVSMQCQENYYGFNCDKFCKPQSFNYDCNTTSGEKNCILDCGQHGSCYWNSERKSFVCKCQPGWIGDQCLFSSYESCSTFKCDLTCTTDALYKYCTCKSDPKSRRCQEILEPLTSATSRRITTVSTSTAINTDKSSHFRDYTETTNAKEITDNKAAQMIHQSSFSPITIIIISILLLLCVSVIVLVIVIRNWRKKDKINNTGFLKHVIRAQMPLPQVVYEPHSYNRITGSVFTSPTSTIMPQSTKTDYDQYTYQSNCTYETPLIRFDPVQDDGDDTYERPISIHNDSMTCGTEVNDDDNNGSDPYEEPRKFL